MSYEFSSGIRLQIGQVIQDPVSSFEYVVDEVLESGANAFAARATRRKRASEGGTAGDKVFLKKYKSPGGSSSWFDGFVDYQQEIRQRLQNHPHTKSRMVEILKFFQRGSGGDTRRRAYYQLFAWEGQANNLRHFIDLRASITKENDAVQRFQIACDFLAGLAAIHDCGVIHSDLKPENLMLNADSKGIWKLKFVDFDFSLLNKKEAPWINPKRAEDKMGYLGTERYLSPEHLQGKRPTEGSDIFTSGLILSELLVGKHPVGEDKELYNRRVLGGQFGKVRLPEAVRAVVKNPDGLDKTINQMLSFEASSRPTASNIAELFQESRKFSIVPTANEGDPSKGDRDSDDDDTEADSEDSALEKAGEEILKGLARSKASPIAIESPEAKADVYLGREIEDKRSFRKIILFLCLLIGIPLLLYKSLGLTFPGFASRTSVHGTNFPNDKKRQSTKDHAVQEKNNRSSGFIPTAAQSLQTTSTQTYSPTPALERNVFLRAKKRVRFNLTGYSIEGDSISRLNLNVNKRANSQDISPGTPWPIMGARLTEFRIWSPLLERISVLWDGKDYQPLGDSADTEHDGFCGSMANGEVGLNPRIHDVEIFNPDGRSLVINCFYNKRLLTHFSDDDPCADHQRFFGEIFELRYKLADAQFIKLRFDNDGEDEGQIIDLATLAEDINNDKQGSFHFIELLPE